MRKRIPLFFWIVLCLGYSTPDYAQQQQEDSLSRRIEQLSRQLKELENRIGRQNQIAVLREMVEGMNKKIGELTETVESMDDRIGELETMMNDSDKDGVPNYLDVEPNTRAGAPVDTNGKEVREDNQSKMLKDSIGSLLKEIDILRNIAKQPNDSLSAHNLEAAAKPIRKPPVFVPDNTSEVLPPNPAVCTATNTAEFLAWLNQPKCKTLQVTMPPAEFRALFAQTQPEPPVSSSDPLLYLLGALLGISALANANEIRKNYFGVLTQNVYCKITGMNDTQITALTVLNANTQHEVLQERAFDRKLIKSVVSDQELESGRTFKIVIRNSRGKKSFIFKKAKKADQEIFREQLVSAADLFDKYNADKG